MNKKNGRRIIASTICIGMLFFNIPIGVFASEISGFNQTSDTFNIEAEKATGGTGFRHYDKFNLTQGDIANLIYKDNYSKFVNLVNNQININGLVQTLKDGNFYNGHAIFVSPLGMVVGASGVLNVGSLSVLTPSQSKFNDFLGKYDSGDLAEYAFGADKYNALITDSHGNILINGRILARENVNLYGDNITIQGVSDNKAGIIAGANNTKYETVDAAKLAFDSLVSNNITNTNSFALENGKIKIVAGYKDYKDGKPDSNASLATVNIENANIGANEVEIKANSTRNSYVLADADEAVKSEINITNSGIKGDNVNILANSQDVLDRNINLTVPTVLLWVFDSDSHLDEYFSDDIYNGFEGIRTSAIVNVTDSIIQATNDLSINAETSSKVNIGSQISGMIELPQFIPAIFYGYGTQTETKINITNSVLKAAGDIDLNAFSENILKTRIADYTMTGIVLKATDAFNLALMKNSAAADTKITIDNSKIEGKNVSAQALAYNEVDNTIIFKERIGSNDFSTPGHDGEIGQGGSAISLGGIINATDIKSAIEVKNESEITAEEDAKLNAYNINDISNWIDSEIADTTGYTKEWREGDSWIKKQFDRLGRSMEGWDRAKAFTFSDFANKFSTKSRNFYDQVYPEDKQRLQTANFQGGAGAIWNNTNTTNNVTVDNSQVSAKNINIKAHTVDATVNETDAYAEEDASWGGALALVINKQNNNNSVDILNSSKLISTENLKVDSIVELPAQQGTLGVGAGIAGHSLTLGINFGFSADDSMDFDFHSVTDNPVSTKFMPNAGIFGFYNNFAVASSAGDKASISAAVIYSELNNNSDINIINSELTSNTGSVVMNSVISASAHDAVDFVNYDGLLPEIKGLVKQQFNKWNHDSGTGIGGAVLVQNFTNNARITVDNSKIKAETGDIKINTAAEQSYLNILSPGGKAETLGINGAVSSQGIHGTTSSSIKNNTELKAQNVSINSGKANVQFTQKGSDMATDGLEFIDDDGNVVLADSRDAKDHITAVAFNGSFTQQTEETVQPESSGAAFGASIVVQNIDRVIKTSVQDSVITAGKIDALSSTYNRNIFVTFAGSSAGGVSPVAANQRAANNGQGGENAPGAMANAGNWIDILDNARENDEDILGLQNLFNQDNPNQQAAQNAQANADNINNQNNIVDNDGNINNNPAGANNPGNNNGNMADNQLNPQNGQSNFSAALAGSVSVSYDESIVATEIKNSTLNVGEELNVSADREHFMFNLNGGLAKSGTVGGGAAVNVFTVEDYTYKDDNDQDVTKTLAGVSSVIDNSIINFTSDSANKILNVTADDKYTILNTGIGLGMTGGDNQSWGAAVGGSFNTNRLLGTTEAKITNDTKIRNNEGKTNDIDVNVASSGDATIWNIGGDAAIEKGGHNANIQFGAAVAGNMDFLEQKINSEITGSTLTNVKNVDIKSELDQNIHAVSVAGTVTQRSTSSYSLDGALGMEFVHNNVTALLKDSTVSSSGDVKLLADSDIKGHILTGDVNFQAGSGVGVGIGAVLGIDNSTISSVIDNSKITNSTSIESKATSNDDRGFLAVNLGLTSDDGKEISTNGVVNIYDTTVESKVINNSELKSSGSVDILSNYKNVNESITAVAQKAQDGLAFGANLLGSYYGNTVQSEIESGSKILQSGSVKINAVTEELINYIPVSLGFAAGSGNAVGANIIANVINNTTNAYLYGDTQTAGKLVIKAVDDTTIKERGGVLAYSGHGTVGLGSIVYYDYLNKNVNAEVKGNTITSGDMSVEAISENSFGGTKKSDGSWDESDMSINPADYTSDLEQNSAFSNWTMAYSMAHGDTASASGAIIIRVIDDTVKANVENSNINASSLNILANDYTIMNTIAGQFSPGHIGVGGNSIFVIGDTNTQAAISGGEITLTNDLNIFANTKKLSHTVLVGGSGSEYIAVNGAVYVNILKDIVTSSVVGSTILADNVNVKAAQMNDNLGVDISVAGSEDAASVGGILYVNYFEDETKALVGDNTKSRTTINAAQNAAVTSDSDYESREYLISVGASGKVGVSGMGIANVMDSTVESSLSNTDITSTNGKLDVKANRGFNKNSNDKTAFFRNWFKGTDAYTEQNKQITQDDLASLAPIVGAINVSAGGTGAGSGTVLVNKSRGSLTSKIDNSAVSTKNGSTVSAVQDFTNFDAVAAVAGAGTGSLNGTGVINSFSETVTAEVKDSTIEKGFIKTDAESNMNLNQLVIAGTGAGKGAAIGLVVDYNGIEDNVYSSIINTTAKEGAIAESVHNIMINNILLAGGGVGQGLSAQVAPIVNKFSGKTISKIDNSTILGGSIALKSFDYLDNLSSVVGVSAAGQGGSLSGYAIRNELSNTSNSYINNSTINTTGDINIAVDSVIDSTNALFSAGIAIQGGNALANVISNTITSDVQGYIKDSTITKSDDINITANIDNDAHLYRFDKIKNTTGNISVAGEGAALSTNVIYTNYDNTVGSYIDNTSSENSGDVTLKANSERRLDNVNIGIGAAAIGASVAVNAISSVIDTTTLSYIDAKSKTMDNLGILNLISRDDSQIDNTLGTIQLAGLGAAAGVGLDMTWLNNTVKSEILSAADGQINAKSADLTSNNILEYDKVNVGVSLGAAGLAGDYVLLKSGKRTGTYSENEQKSGIETALSYVTTPLPSSEDIETGSISRINGNLKTNNNINVNANSQIKGIGADALELTNVTVTAGIGTGSVGIKDVDLASNTNASISNGTIESVNGKVAVNAESKSNTDITNVQVDVSGIKFTGGSAMYKNSSETVAQIVDATVKSAGDIDVISKSESNSDINATNVVVTGGGIVAVDLAENTDTNKSIALISSSENGTTNIDAGGKLTLHSTTNTDLKSTKQTVNISGVEMVGVSKNSATVNSINRAIIENVNGEINTNGLDIIADYDKMSAFSKANVTSVKLGNIVSVDSSGAFINADFKSGIDSESGLVLNNSGDTNITSAKDNGTEGILAQSEINNVHVSISGFVASTSANAENNATSTTVLKAKEHNAQNLNVNSNLKTTAKSDAGAVKATVGIGVNAVSVDTKDASTLNVEIAGKNTIIGNAVINALHNTIIKSDLSAFNFGGLIGGGQRIRIASNLAGNTLGTIDGDFNANNAAINFNTIRESILSKSSGSGSGVINVNDSKATNHLTGSSILNISNFNTNDSANNNFEISNVATNTQDIESSDGSGGLISVSVNNTDTEFNTSAATNINNSNINSKYNVEFNVENNAIVKDSSVTGGGGFIAVADNEANNSYTTNAKLSLNNTKIDAKDIKLESSSDIRTPNDTVVDYVGGAGGFVAQQILELHNTINQTSEIEVKNSKLYASGDIVLDAITSSLFKQKTDTNVGGFVAIPRSKNWLDVTNNNKISIDSTSKLVASNKLEIDFDSNNTLEARALSSAEHFGFRDPVAESWLTLAVNNTLQNNGSIEGGNIVDIDFMENSVNNLTQYSHSEAYGIIPTTSEDGKLTKTVNNVLNVETSADITSGKNIDIRYSDGTGTEKSEVGYKYTTYAVFGIPISHSNSWESKNVRHNTTLKNNDEIVAGQGNNKYIKINRDGSIDKDTRKGFYDNDYILYDDVLIDGQTIKDQNLASVSIRIQNTDKTITKLNTSITDLNEKISELNAEKVPLEAELQEITDLLPTHELKTEADVNAIIQNDIKTAVVGDNTNQIDENKFNTISGAYQDKLTEIETYNNAHPDTPKDIITISEFINDPNNDYGLTTEQKDNIVTAYNDTSNQLIKTPIGEYVIYKNQYVIVENPTGAGIEQTCNEIVQLNTEISNITNEIQPYNDKISEQQSSLAVLTEEKANLQAEYDRIYNTDPSEYETGTNAKYSIVFNDVVSGSGRINVEGTDNRYINGNGIFSAASSGFVVDNYSTRSLVFRNINDTSLIDSGLTIGGKNHGEFADKPQALSGVDAYNYVWNKSGHKSFNNLPTAGVHYENGGTTDSGITINNYYDVNHPFAENFDIPHPTLISDIIFQGDINTNANFNVWNESGNIGIVNNSLNYNNMSLTATNGVVTMFLGGDSSTPYTLKTDDNIFAADGFSILTNRDFDIQGTIKTGYSGRNITITDEMLLPQNLIVDATSGEKNMINLGGGNISPYLNSTNNIKAIYKDGQIYLYNIPELSQNNGVNTFANSVSSTGNIIMANGYQNIVIDNQTASQLNVADIINSKITALISDDIQGGNITKNTIENAYTSISSAGKLSLNGVIYNNVKDLDYFIVDGGTLNITANNGLDIKQQTEGENVVDSIRTGGETSIITNSLNTNILGNIASKGNLNIVNNGSGFMNIEGAINGLSGDITVQNKVAGDLTLKGNITGNEGNIAIINNGGNLDITSSVINNINKPDASGLISIVNASNAGTMTINSQQIINGGIGDENGKAIIINNQSNTNGAAIYAADMSANKGDIEITNTADNLSVAGAISNVVSGDISITNSGKRLQSTASITNNSGNTTITNNGTERTLIGSAITNKDGNVTLSSSGNTIFELTGAVDNSGGNVIITNENDRMRILNSISNKGGDITITNNGEHTEIVNSITNTVLDDISGSISITNAKGNLRLLELGDEPAIIRNTSYDDEKGITITNLDTATFLIIDSDIVSTNKGDINIINAGSQNTIITGDITASNGNIDFSNSNGGDTTISGAIKTSSGDVSISNNNSGSMSIEGAIAALDGNIDIVNNESLDLTIAGNIENTGNITISQENSKELIINSVIHETNGNVAITNTNSGDIRINRTSEITNDNGGISISNIGTSNIYQGGPLTATGEIDVINTEGAIYSYSNIVTDGDIVVANTSENLIIGSNDIGEAVTYGTTNGNIQINNFHGDLILQENASIINLSDSTSGNGITIINMDDLGYQAKGLELNGYIFNTGGGNIDITNQGHEGATIAGTIENMTGNIYVTNYTNELELAGKIITYDGNVSINNSGADGTILTDKNTIATENGKISVRNSNGDFVMQDGAKILVANAVNNNDFDVVLQNDTGAAQMTIAGEIENTGINGIKIVNNSNSGMNIDSTAVISNQASDTNISNTAGDLTIANGAEITNIQSGDMAVTNEGGKFTIAGLLQHLGIGNATIKNSGSDGFETTDTSKIAINQGALNVENTNGALSTNGVIENKKGNISITNSGATADIDGTVFAKEGNIGITNSNAGELNVKGNIKNENGGVNITSNSADGTKFAANSVVENIKGNTTITNNAGNLIVENNATIKNTESGNLVVENKGGKFTIAGLLQHLGIGNATIKNSGSDKLDISGDVNIANGNIDIQNSNAGRLVVSGNVTNTKGKTIVTNTSADGIKIATTGSIHNNDGNIEISNTGANGINIEGLIKTDKQDIAITNKDSDITIGEYTSNNDNYVNSAVGNVVINQINGNILNNITDPVAGNKHQNYNYGTEEQSYKTLIATGNNLTIDVKDGSIGSTTNTNPGFSIDASTRDYTESINVNVGGSIIAKAVNENTTGKQLINLRAKESDMNIKEVVSDGNVILTASDWKQADTLPTPADDNYFKGYSILSSAEGNNPAVTGQMISVIASDNIGSTNKKMIYNQDTAGNPNSSVSFEAENDINITGKANSDNELKINQLISKHGSIDMDMESDTVIGKITADGGLILTQKAQNLTIKELSITNPSRGDIEFDDILYPHDNITLDGEDGTPIIPKYAVIRALDAMDTPERSDSTLKIYSAYVTGNNGDNAKYYPDGSRLADFTLMADNIYVNSDKAPNSNIPTKSYPNGYKQTDTTYTDADFGGSGDTVYRAEGLNVLGDSGEISIDILGVDRDLVDELLPNAQRNNYTMQKHNYNTPSKFKNDNNRLVFYDYDFKANDVVVSINDYANSDRPVSVDTIYANNAYINTPAVNFKVEDGIISNYAEFRSKDKLGIVDNDFRRLLTNADIQLYTAKTGSFGLDFDGTINMQTTAPTVYNNPHMLVNGYHSEWNFVNIGQKESKDLYENKKMTENLNKNNYNEPQKRISERFDTTTDEGLSSDFEILDISTTGASVKNDRKLKRGKNTKITIKFDDVDITVTAKVVKVEGNRAGLEFIDMPKDVANKILYRYMQRPNSMKSNLSMSL